MPIEHEFKDSRYDDTQLLRMHDTDYPTWEARMASLLIEKWGLVAAAPDGEDSAGRSQVRLLNPNEVVERACTTAQLAVATFRERGWVYQMPSLKEIHEQVGKRENGGPK